MGKLTVLTARALRAVLALVLLGTVLAQVGMAAALAIATPEQIARGAAAVTSTGRVSHSEQAADLVVLLADDATANVTGSCFRHGSRAAVPHLARPIEIR